jgi:hypothetical protein
MQSPVEVQVHLKDIKEFKLYFTENRPYLYYKDRRLITRMLKEALAVESVNEDEEKNVLT